MIKESTIVSSTKKKNYLITECNYLSLTQWVAHTDSKQTHSLVH